MPSARSTTSTSASLVASSQLTPTRSALTRRMFTPCASAAATTESARPGAEIVSVSNHVSFTNERPGVARTAAASCEVRVCTPHAMRRNPSGPCQHAYIPDITASST